MSGTAVEAFFNRYIELYGTSLSNNMIGVVPYYSASPTPQVYFEVWASDPPEALQSDASIQRSGISKTLGVLKEQVNAQLNHAELASLKEAAEAALANDRSGAELKALRAIQVLQKAKHQEMLTSRLPVSAISNDGPGAYESAIPVPPRVKIKPPVQTTYNTAATALDDVVDNEDEELEVGVTNTGTDLDADEQEDDDDEVAQNVASSLGKNSVFVDVESDPNLTPTPSSTSTSTSNMPDDEDKDGGGSDSGNKVRFTIPTNDRNKTQFKPVPTSPPTPSPYSIQGVDIRRIITPARMRLTNMPDYYILRADQSRKAAANIEDPLWFLKCWESSFDELTDRRLAFIDPATNTCPSLEQVEELLRFMESDQLRTNYGFTSAMDRIHPKMAEYMYDLLNMQFGRHNPELTEARISLGDVRGVLQAMDFQGTFGVGASYLRGEIIATAKRILLYDGVKFKPDADNPRKYTFSRDGTTYFTCEAASKKSADGTGYPIKIKLAPNFNQFSPEERTQLLRDLVRQLAELRQERQLNGLPFKTMFKDPDLNINFLMIANGEAMMNIQISKEQNDEVLAAIDRKYANDPALRDKKKDLWTWCYQRSEMYENEFVRGNVVFRKNIDPRILSHGGPGGTQKYTIKKEATKAGEITVRGAYDARIAKATLDGLYTPASADQLRGRLRSRL